MAASRSIALSLVVSGALCVSAADAQSQPSELSPEVRAYLSSALDTLQAITLGRDTLPWSTIRDSVFLLAYGARKPSETYGAIAWALDRVNPHGFLQARRPGAVSELVEGNVGYVHVPQRGGSGTALGDSLHSAIRRLQDAGACGWIVDLRANGGGNMWPMLAGIGPLLADSIVGSFGAGSEAQRWFYRRGVSGLLRPDGRLDTLSQITVPVLEPIPASAPVAILIDGGTGSSGEAVAVAFWGRPNSRSFGSRTAGFATANRGSRLPDGANMVVTTGYYTDRRGVQHSSHLRPDTLIAGAPPGWPFPTDRVAEAAAIWLRQQPACRKPE